MEFFMSKSRCLALASVSTVALSLIIGMPQVASAQTAPATEETGGIETVIVTARKREESSQDVPASLTTVRGDALRNLTAAGADLQAFSARVPSLVVESSFGRTFPRFYMRGLGNSDFDLNASQPVSLIYDEVVQENPLLKGFPAFDVERIEVLRGPQGTLFGRNTPAGIVKFDSVKPSANQASYAQAGVRTLGGLDLETGLGVSLSDTVHARLSLQAQSQDSWISDINPAGGTNDLGGYGSLAWRGQIRFEPTDALDINLNVHGRNMSGDPVAFYGNALVKGKQGLREGFKRDEVRHDATKATFDLESLGAVAKIEYDFGSVVLTSITGYETLEFYSQGDVDGGTGSYDSAVAPVGGPIVFFSETADGIDDLTQFTQELRLSSDTDSAFSWQVGAYLFDESVDVSSYAFDTFRNGARTGYGTQNQETQSWAVFGSGTLAVGERLKLTAGLRYSDDDKTLVSTRLQSPFGQKVPLVLTDNLSDEAVSWDVSAVYEATDDINLYARAARGYRAPSAQGRVLFSFDPTSTTTADSEFVTSFEVGTKGFALDRTVRFDVSAYTLEIEDQQLTAVGGGGNFTRLLNAQSKGYGFEAELDWRPTDAFRAGASVSYNNTELDDASLKSSGCGFDFIRSFSTVCTVTDPFVGGAYSINGNSLPNAPEWIGNVWARYSVDLPNGNQAYVATDWAYKGQTNFFLYDSVEFVEDGFWEGGFRAGYLMNDGDLEFSIYGRNILDETRLVYAIDFTTLAGLVNAPRVFGAEVKAKF
jgi:iron complex outermembrane recepter protein